MTDARELAYDITRRVNSAGGYLNLLLRYKLDRVDIDARERALVVEISYGIQRHRNKLDYIIDAFSARDLADLDPEVLDMLRLGVYQLSEMRVPSHAAVNETVDLAKRRLERAAGFVNAVLRSVSTGLQDLTLPSRDNIVPYLETVYSHPRWLVDRFLDRYGEAEAEALCSAENTIPSLTLRVNTRRGDAASILSRIKDRGGKGDYSKHLQEALVQAALPHDLLMRLLEEGACVVQDESSMLVGHAVNPLAGNTIIDACSAPGGKATHLAQLGGDSCRIIAMDVNPRRLEALRKSLRRLGLDNVEVKKGDATRLSEFIQEPADTILVDAPCSGLGTLRRNPELKWRRIPEDIADLASLQLALLQGCADAVKPGGSLVYSVCTYTREETADVIRAFLDTRDDFKPAYLSPYLPTSLARALEPEGWAQLMPHLDNMDGMFIARMVRS